MASPLWLLLDDAAPGLRPCTDLRASFDLRTGALTTRQRWERLLGRPPEALWLRDAAMHDLVREQTRLPVNPDRLAAGSWWVINGRWLGTAHVNALRQLPVGQALQADDGLLAAHLSADDAHDYLQSGVLPAAVHGVGVGGQALIARPWHILDALETTLRQDLELLATGAAQAPPPYVHVLGPHRVHLNNCRLQPGVVLNAEAGAIHLDADTIIGAHSVIEGPCYVGPHTQLAAHSYLRPHTVVGPWSKVAGEISFSIIDGFTNKAHLGYLGHSLVGQWVNLGASTTVSNLKNTYGSIRVQLHPDAAAEDTGRQFLGPVLGDYVRTAIGSRMLTGSCLPTGVMLALSSFAPKCARPFGFYTDAHPAGVPCEVDKFLAAARAMMARRKQPLSPVLEARLRELMNE